MSHLFPSALPALSRIAFTLSPSAFGRPVLTPSPASLARPFKDRLHAPFIWSTLHHLTALSQILGFCIAIALLFILISYIDVCMYTYISVRRVHEVECGDEELLQVAQRADRRWSNCEGQVLFISRHSFLPSLFCGRLPLWFYGHNLNYVVNRIRPW
jgi:hypothetical protein